MLLDNYNKRFKRSTKDKKKVVKSSEILDELEKIKGTNECIEVEFQASDDKGNLITKTVEGISIILPNTRQNSEFYAAKIARYNVGSTCSVTVKDVDRDNKTVYVAFYRDSNQIYDALIKEVEEGLKNNKKVEVYGTISGIAPSRRKAFINIYNIGLKGYLYIKDYTNQYLDYFDQTEIYEYDEDNNQIPKKFKVKEIRDGKLILAYEEDLWKGVEQKVKPNTCMILECTHVKEEYRYFWGKSNLVPVSIQVDYKDTMIPLEGNFYNCVITEVDEKKHILRAKTLHPVASKKSTSIKFVK